MAAGEYKDPPRAVKQNAFADTSELLKIQTNAKSTPALFAFLFSSAQSVHWKSRRQGHRAAASQRQTANGAAAGASLHGRPGVRRADLAGH